MHYQWQLTDNNISGAPLYLYALPGTLHKFSSARCQKNIHSKNVNWYYAVLILKYLDATVQVVGHAFTSWLDVKLECRR